MLVSRWFFALCTPRPRNFFILFFFLGERSRAAREVNLRAKRLSEPAVMYFHICKTEALNRVGNLFRIARRRSDRRRTGMEEKEREGEGEKPPSTGMIFRNDAPRRRRRCLEASHENASCPPRFEWNGNPPLTFIGFVSIAFAYRVCVLENTLDSYNLGESDSAKRNRLFVKNRKFFLLLLPLFIHEISLSKVFFEHTTVLLAEL